MCGIPPSLSLRLLVRPPLSLSSLPFTLCLLPPSLECPVVRMLSPGQIGCCWWASLVLLALVSHSPSKAQDQGKRSNSPPTLPSSPLLSSPFRSPPHPSIHPLPINLNSSDLSCFSPRASLHLADLPLLLNTSPLFPLFPPLLFTSAQPLSLFSLSHVCPPPPPHHQSPFDVQVPSSQITSRSRSHLRRIFLPFHPGSMAAFASPLSLLPSCTKCVVMMRFELW